MAKSNKDRICEDLKRRILTLELEPGAVLDETKLSSEYGISRTPLRDLFRLLAGEGYIDLRDNRGAFVSPMDHATMRDFFLTAPAIYASVGRLAAEHAKPAQVEQLRDIQRQFRAAVDGNRPDDMIYWNDRFHDMVGQMANNRYLMPSLQRLLIDHARLGQTFWRPRNATMAERIRIAADHHDQFIDLIAAGNADAVVALTNDHWALSRDHLDLFVRPAPLEMNLDATG